MDKKNTLIESISKFEELNKIKLNNYMSSNSSEESDKHIDNYIGEDIFQDRVYDWLELFEEKDRPILLKLLENYRYFTENRIKRELYRIIKEIINDSDPNDVYIITFPSKKGVASGGDNLRSALICSLLGEFKKENIIHDTEKNIDKVINNAKKIIFLDDIVGSGTTLYGNVKECVKNFQLDKNRHIKLHVVIIYGRKDKIEKKIRDLKKIGIDIDYRLIVIGEKCFDKANIFSQQESQKNKEIVKTYEKIIEEYGDKEDKGYVLGFQENQFLVSLYYGTPNNTLSNFWKPSEMSVPLFIRSSYIRPNISDIKKRKENNAENAYLLAMLEKKNNESE